MAEMALFSFILNNFASYSISSAVLFHCWQAQDVSILSRKASTPAFYLQYVNLAHLAPDSKRDLSEKYFESVSPINGVLLDINCDNAGVVMQTANLKHFYNNHYHWLIYDQNGDIANFRRHFDAANLGVNSDVTYVKPEISTIKANSSNFIQYDVYNNGPNIGGKLNITIDRKINCTKFNCKVQEFLSDLHQRAKYENRNKQNDIQLRVTTVYTPKTANSKLSEEDKFAHLNDVAEPHIDASSRFGYQQLILLREMLQCSFQHFWEPLLDIGECNDVPISDLIRGNTDLVSIPMDLKSTQLRYVRPIVESAIYHAVCIFRTPRKTGILKTGEIYLEPFSGIVWLAFAVLLFMGALQLWGVFYIETRRLQLNCPQLSSSSLLSTLLIAFGTVCAQGTNLMPQTYGGRLAFSTIVFVSFIMYNYYTAIVVSTLLAEPAKSQIKTLAQLAESTLEVGLEPSAFNFEYFNRNSNVPAVRDLVAHKIDSSKNNFNIYMPRELGISRVLNEAGNFAYIFEATSGYVLVEQAFEADEICDLNEIPLSSAQTLKNFLNKNSTFDELLRLRLLRLLESGIDRRNVRYWLRDRLYCFPITKIASVGLKNAAPLLFLLGLGFLLALLALIMELLWHKCQSSKIKRLSLSEKR